MASPILVSADPLNNDPSLLSILLIEIENLSPSLPSYIEIEIPEIILLKNEELQKKIIEFLEEKTMFNREKKENNSMVFGINSVEIRYNREVQAALRMFQYKNSMDSLEKNQNQEKEVFLTILSKQDIENFRDQVITDSQILVRKWRRFWEVSPVQ